LQLTENAHFSTHIKDMLSVCDLVCC